jgi:hypothetical protein
MWIRIRRGGTMSNIINIARDRCESAGIVPAPEALGNV